MKDNSLLVRINYISEDSSIFHSKTDKHKAHIVKKNNSSGNNKYMLCGGIINKRGGMIIYNARNRQEASEIARNNMMTKHEKRKYTEVKRDVVSIPSNLLSN